MLVHSVDRFTILPTFTRTSQHCHHQAWAVHYLNPRPPLLASNQALHHSHTHLRMSPWPLPTHPRTPGLLTPTFSLSPFHFGVTSLKLCNVPAGFDSIGRFTVLHFPHWPPDAEIIPSDFERAGVCVRVCVCVRVYIRKRERESFSPLQCMSHVSYPQGLLLKGDAQDLPLISTCAPSQSVMWFLLCCFTLCVRSWTCYLCRSKCTFYLQSEDILGDLPNFKEVFEGKRY